MNQMRFRGPENIDRNPEKKRNELIENLKKALKIAAIVIGGFLLSRGGKEAATESELMDIKAKIENSSEYEKISPSLIKQIEELAEQTVGEKYLYDITHLTDIQNNDKLEKISNDFLITFKDKHTIALIASLAKKIKDDGNIALATGKDVTIEVNKECGIITKFTESHTEYGGNGTGINIIDDKLYVITNDGKIERKGYQNGDAIKIIEDLLCSKPYLKTIK